MLVAANAVSSCQTSGATEVWKTHFFKVHTSIFFAAPDSNINLSATKLFILLFINVTHRHFVGSLYVEDQVLDKGYLI